MAIGAPRILISAPAMPGPAISEPDTASAFLLCASTNRSRETICVNTICAAVPPNTCTQPSTTPTTYNHVIDNTPVHAAIGTVMSANANADSPTTYTGNLRTRSSHTPAGNESNTNGANSNAIKNPICVGEALSTVAAVSGNASMVICAPKWVMTTEAKMRR